MKALAILGLIVIAPALAAGVVLVGAFLLMLIAPFFMGLYELWRWIFCLVFRRPYVKYFTDI